MIATDRLILATWRDAHRAPMAAINADVEVMRYFLAPMSAAETDAQIDRQIAAQAELGFCFWAVERRDTGELIGMCGLKTGAPDTPIAADLEIGWRFGRHGWGQGFATEAARAAMAHGFSDARVPRIAAITTLTNVKSWAVMERLGMTRAAALDFDHPAIPVGHPVRAHITYFIDRP